MVGKSVVPFVGSDLPTGLGGEGNPSIAAAPAENLVLVASALDVTPLASILPGRRILGTPPSRHSASSGRTKRRGRTTSPYSRPTMADIRPKGFHLCLCHHPTCQGRRSAGCIVTSAASELEGETAQRQGPGESKQEGCTSSTRDAGGG